MSKLSKLFSIFFIGLLLGIGSCTDDDDCCDPIPDPAGPEVWVANEGGFFQGNASLDIYDTENNVYRSSVFDQANDRGIGDIFQSITFLDEKAYLIVNNSQRIEVINTSDYSLITTITKHVYSPRYGVTLNDNLFVSDLNQPFIYIIDTESNAVVDSIPTGVPVEEMIVHQGNIFASAYNFTNATNQIHVISVDQKKIIENIDVGLNPNAMVKDKDNMIWVMCDGQYNADSLRSENQAIFRINPNTSTVDKSFDFDTFVPQYPNRLAVNENNAQHIYFMTSLGLHKLDINATMLSEDVLLNPVSSTYGFGINPQNDEIYIGDPADFSATGTINVYLPTGALKETLNAGHLPSRFYFR